MIEFVERFGGLADELGWPAQDGCRIVDDKKTENPGIARPGDRRTLTVKDGRGRKWTVHHDPSWGLFAGAHPSSGRD